MLYEIFSFSLNNNLFVLWTNLFYLVKVVFCTEQLVLLRESLFWYWDHLIYLVTVCFHTRYLVLFSKSVLSLYEIWPESYGPFQIQFLFTIIEIWAITPMGHFLHNSLSKSLKYYLWQLWAISITIPYQHHWIMTYDCYEQFPSQFLFKIIEIWPMTAMGKFH